MSLMLLVFFVSEVISIPNTFLPSLSPKSIGKLSDTPPSIYTLFPYLKFSNTKGKFEDILNAVIQGKFG